MPWSDPDYPRLRSSIALPAPDGSAQTALKLNARFALHPALAELLPLWQQGRLAVIPAAGSPDPTRSHFDAQHYWETAHLGRSSAAPGWLNRLAGLGRGAGVVRGLGVGESNPHILEGRAPVQLVAHGKAAQRPGTLQNTQAREALLALYDGGNSLSKAFRQGADSRLRTAQDLTPEMHAAENGTRGTDHGHGNAMWLIGPGVAGGRWWGEWSGLAAANLHEQRDVPVHHDFRAVLAQLLRPIFGLRDSQLADVLPDTRWDARLDGLLALA